MGRGKCDRQEPRNLEPRKLILEAESYFSRKFAPPKITRYTVYYNMYVYDIMYVYMCVEVRQLANGYNSYSLGITHTCTRVCAVFSPE